LVDIANNLFSTRRGSIFVGLGAAAIAAVIVFVYLHNYRNSLNSAAAPASVLVAKNLIPKGTPGSIVGHNGEFQLTQIPRKELQIGALTDPAALNGRIALADIYPGQQLTANTFALAPADALQNQLRGTDRAINVSLDSIHGMTGLVSPGDRIDIFVGTTTQGVHGSQGVIKLLLSNVLVLRAPLYGGSGIYTLRAPEAQAEWLAAAHDFAHLWFVVRPATGAKVQLPGGITIQTLLQSYKALK
jgi:Flp pilus assembly protein CpaB